jgi:hypothetical protein
MATSVPDDLDWPADAPPAERALRRWVDEQLDDRVTALPSVRLTDLGEGPPVRYVAVDSGNVEQAALQEARRLQRDDRVLASDLAVLRLFANPNPRKWRDVGPTAT